MSDLSGLISTDSRNSLQRLRRRQLTLMAERRNLTFPPNCGAEALRPILVGAGITGDEPEFDDITRWRSVTQQDESGNSHIERYPSPPEHATAGKVVDYDSQIEARAANNKPTEDELFDRSQLAVLKQENAQLRADNAEMTSVISDRLAKLESDSGAGLPMEKWLPWQLIQVARERGIEYKGLSKEERIAALRA